MKFKMDLDQVKMERSLKRAADRFGDSTAQAVARWGVHTCRELAEQTQAHGNGGARKRQINSIEAGIVTTVAVLKGAKVRKGTVYGEWNGKPTRFPVQRWLKDAAAVSAWVEKHRGRRGRTPKRLPVAEMAACSLATFKKARTLRGKQAGLAKGPWLGAGQRIAAAQKGTGQIRIGKNFLSYAQKHADKGTATHPRAGFRPEARLSNRARHAGDKYVLKPGAVRDAIRWGGRKTASWYRRAAKEALDKS